MAKSAGEHDAAAGRLAGVRDGIGVNQETGAAERVGAGFRGQCHRMRAMSGGIVRRADPPDAAGNRPHVVDILQGRVVFARSHARIAGAYRLPIMRQGAAKLAISPHKLLIGILGRE